MAYSKDEKRRILDGIYQGMENGMSVNQQIKSFKINSKTFEERD